MARGLVRIDLDDFLAAVAAAGGADVMRDVEFAATFTFNQVIERERVVRTAFVAPGTGNLAFWKRPHGLSPERPIGTWTRQARAV